MEGVAAVLDGRRRYLFNVLMINNIESCSVVRSSTWVFGTFKCFKYLYYSMIKDRTKRLQYHKDYNKKHYALNKEAEIKRVLLRKLKIKEWYIEYRSKLSCIRCLENDPICLDFHHIDPSTKIEEVPLMVHKGCSIQTILNEIAKCIVLCANCHRKEHR